MADSLRFKLVSVTQKIKRLPSEQLFHLLFIEPTGFNTGTNSSSFNSFPAVQARQSHSKSIAYLLNNFHL